MATARSATLGPACAHPCAASPNWQAAASDCRQDWSQNYGTELYNHSVDPGENRNVFASLTGSAVATRLKQRLHRGWAGIALPALAEASWEASD